MRKESFSHVTNNRRATTKSLLIIIHIPMTYLSIVDIFNYYIFSIYQLLLRKLRMKKNHRKGDKN